MNKSNPLATASDGHYPQMGPGETVANKRNITTYSSSLDATVTVHILQHQPTSRPIEDRYSIDVRARDTSDSDIGETALLLGVYDGHRGSSAAEYVAQALPSEVLSTAASETQSNAASIQETFELFDRQMLSSFQDAHPAPTASPAQAPRRILGSIASKLLKSKTREGHNKEPATKEENTTAALRVLSGCTASMLMVKLPHSHSAKPSAEAINLGDSRVVVASLGAESKIHFSSVDVNSGVKDEQSLITSQHPNDDAKDIFVGGRLFGETLSTRGFGDGIYKLPLRSSQDTVKQGAVGESSIYLELTPDQQNQHKHLINQLSAHQQAVSASKGKKIISIIDRYDTLFWAYKSPPYISATPQVTEVPLEIVMPIQNDTSAEKEASPMIVILATDGLWDLVSSEEAVSILSQALHDTGHDSAIEDMNMAQVLFNGVVQRTGRKPGDDVTVLVLLLPRTQK